MAGTSGSDRLMFPIGFDLDGAVKDAGNEWNNTYYDKLNKIVQKKPLVAKISFDTKQLDNLDDVRKRLQQLKLQPVTPETKSAIQSLVKELKSLEKILERIDRLNKSAAAASSGPNAVRAARIAEIESREAGRAAIDREKARQAAARAAQAEAKLEQAVRRTGNAYKSTEGYIERLLKRTLVLFGVHQVTRFAQKLRDVTAEFELQRVSLGAIIQDQERANALFNQIKTFAVQSPFEIKDLVGYVKQLSAYRIETDKLFDTTKRLADVSAGLGTDMGRLILAYGQVRAASVLRGQEVRQFTETGIPLIQLLADKFTALRGEVVSTSEVFDLISQRAVSFKMVEEIFNDMTNAGGMFYNMQEKQAQTLAGQWSNLKDSLSVMYDEMGNVSFVRSAMESVIKTTKTLAKNWELVGGIMIQVLGGAVIIGLVNKFKSLWSSIGNQMYAATSKVANAQAKYNAALDAQNALLPTATKLEVSAANAKVKTAANALKAAKALEVQAASANRLIFALKRIGAALKANWFGILISAALTAAQVISHLIKKSNELKNALAYIKKDGEKTTEVMARNFEILAKKAVQAADGSREQKDALDELQRTYRDIIPTHKLTIENLKEMAGNYELLTEAIREYSRQQILSNKIETIIGNTTEKVSNAQTKLRKKLLKLDYIDERTIERVFSGIEKYARETSDNVTTVISKAFSEFAGIRLTAEQLDEISGWKGFEDIVNAYREQEREIKKVSEGQAELLGLTKEYADAIEEAQFNILKWEDANLDISETYEFDKRRAEKAASEYLAVIKKIFSDSGLTFQDVWVDGKFIDMDAIENELRSAGNKVSSQAYKAFGNVRSAYEEIVPTEKFSKVVNDKLSKIAEGFGVNMDLVKRYLKDGETNIKDYAKSIKDSIEELEGNIKATNAAIENSDPLNTSEIDKLKKSLAQYKSQLRVLTKFYEFLRKFIIESEKGGRSSGDKRLSNLKEEISLLEKVYSKYKDYTHYIGKDKAQARINKEFGKTLEIFKKYGIELPKTSEEYQDALRKLQDVMRGLPDSQKDVMELGFKIENVNWEDTKNELERQIKRLADEVSRTKTANEFFDKMLNMTGDQQLSATVTMSVYGDTGEGLQEKLIEQIRDAFKGIEDEQINLAIGVDSIDYQKLREIWEADKLLGEDTLRKIPSKYDDTIKQILDSGESANAKLMESFSKLLLSYDEIAQKRVNVENEATKKIEDIDRGLALFEMQNAKDMAKAQTEEEKKKLQAALDAARQRASAAKEGVVSERDLELFKLEDLYIRFFDSIHTVTKDEATFLRKNLRAALFGAFQNGAISASELRKELKALDEQFEKLINETGFFGTYTQSGFDGLIQKTRDYADELDAVIARMRKLKSGEELSKGDQNFLDKVLKIFGTEDTGRSYAQLSEKQANDSEKMATALEMASGEMGSIASEAGSVLLIIDQIIKAVHATIQGIGEVRDQLNSFRSDTRQIEGGFWDAFEYIQNFDNYAFEGWERLKSGDVVGSTVSVVKSIVSIFGTAQQQKVKRLNKEIERQADVIDALDYAYSRLEKEADKVFGSEYVSNIRKQRENIEAQIEAVRKQMDAEKDKGKGADDNKIKDYEKSIRELEDSIEEVRSKVAEQMLGTDLTSAARTFAQSWLDAYKEFGDTRKAIEEEMQSMMENLIVEAVLGAVMQQALKPVFDMIENMEEGDFYNEQFWSDIVSAMNRATNNAVAGADATMKKLEAAGVNIRDLGSDFTGISKDIASASEESILGLTSLINTSLYYVSNIDRNVAQIVAIMQGGGYELTSGDQMSDLVTLQNQHLAHLPQIAANTAATAERCERAAQACEAIAANLDRVIKPNGVAGNFHVNTSISS